MKDKLAKALSQGRHEDVLWRQAERQLLTRRCASHDRAERMRTQEQQTLARQAFGKAQLKWTHIAALRSGASASGTQSPSNKERISFVSPTAAKGGTDITHLTELLVAGEGEALARLDG